MAVAAALLLLLSAAGLVALSIVRSRHLDVPSPFSHGVFFFLFERHERPFILVQAAVAALVFVVGRRFRPDPAVPIAPPSRFRSRWLLVALSAVTLGFTLLGTRAVFHDTSLTMDELAPEFEARLIARGRFDARLPDEWKDFGRALTPIGIRLSPAEHTWRSVYLPGYSAIRALFMVAGLPTSANPVLAALTVLGVAATASRLWPGNARAVSFATLFLLTSSQFLVNSMTFYSMPAHLCLNVWWLYLFLRGDRVGLLLVPWLGALALLLHNPVPHARFAAPFLLRLLLSRRTGWCAYFAVVYGAALVFMFSWYRVSSDVTQVGDYIKVFAGSSAFGLLEQLMSFTLVFTWQSPLLALAFLLGVLGWRRLGPTERDLCVGIALTLVVHAMFPSHQGHGWGYRYVYGVLGSIVLLGVSGILSLRPSTRTVKVLAAGAVVVAAGFQLPLRLLQAETFVTPYVRAIRLISSRPVEIVVVDAAAAWYAQDLIRNDPFLENVPKVLRLGLLTREQVDRLGTLPKGKVFFLGAAELARLGLPAWYYVRTPPAGP